MRAAYLSPISSWKQGIWLDLVLGPVAAAAGVVVGVAEDEEVEVNDLSLGARVVSHS